MLRIQSLVSPFSSTIISHAHPVLFCRRYSVVLSPLCSHQITYHSSSVRTDHKFIPRLIYQKTPLKKGQHFFSASFSSVISARANGQKKQAVFCTSIRKVSASLMGSKMSYQCEQRGSIYNEDFRLYIKEGNGTIVSPMHDIPLK